ncbi:MAG TPA: ABC transporter permease [Solirubrobacteraceae bacterium]|nr:ABC transporter permease [Solirubrobacteraceae bacterium]
MRRVIGKRLATSIPTILGCSMVVFAFRYMLPGGPIQDMLGSGAAGEVTATQLHAMKVRLGLNESVPAQYWHWLLNVLHGNLGTSYYSQEPVTTVLGQRVVPSLELIIGALLLATIVGGAVGIAAAVLRARRAGRVLLAATGLGISIPDFWLATVAAAVFGLELGIFPPVGFTPLSAGLWGNLDSIILPVLCLSIVTGCFLARHMQSAMSAVLATPYIRTAWAMGVPSWRVYLNCALRNAAGPVITFIPLAFAALIGGTVLVENVFDIPGLGTEIVNSVSNQDYPVVQGTVLLVGVLVALLNLLADVGMVLIDPRVRRGNG